MIEVLIKYLYAELQLKIMKHLTEKVYILLFIHFASKIKIQADIEKLD